MHAPTARTAQRHTSFPLASRFRLCTNLPNSWGHQTLRTRRSSRRTVPLGFLFRLEGQRMFLRRLRIRMRHTLRAVHRVLGRGETVRLAFQPFRHRDTSSRRVCPRVRSIRREVFPSSTPRSRHWERRGNDPLVRTCYVMSRHILSGGRTCRTLELHLGTLVACQVTGGFHEKSCV